MKKYVLTKGTLTAVELDALQANVIVTDFSAELLAELPFPIGADAADFYPEMIARFTEHLDETGEVSLFYSGFYIQKGDQQVAKRINRFCLLCSPQTLYLFSEVPLELTDIASHFTATDSLATLESLTLSLIDWFYQEYIAELKRLGNQIEVLKEAAARSTKTEDLRRIATVDEAIIYLEKNIKNQNEVTQQLVDHPCFAQPKEHRIRKQLLWHSQQAQHLADIYQGLIRSISSLFSSMMSNHLNNLMKYLNSLALILSVPTLIAGIWGMNTGGLPGRHSVFGTLGMLVVILLITSLFTLYLIKKEYLKKE